MTLIAAAVAWFAVQEQIQAQESDKQLEKEEAKFAAVIVFRSISIFIIASYRWDE